MDRNRWALGFVLAALVVAGWLCFVPLDWLSRSRAHPEVTASSNSDREAEATPRAAPAVAPAPTLENAPIPIASRALAGDLELELRTDEALLRIRVVAAGTSEPLAGIPMALRPLGGTWHWEGAGRSRGSAHEELLTDEHGLCDYLVPAGQGYDLMVNTFEQRDVESKEVGVPALGAGERRSMRVEIATARGSLWHGRAVDADTGQGLPAADISILANTSIGGAIGQPLRARPDGRFEVEMPSWSHRRVRATAPGYSWAEASLGAGGEDASRPVLVRLRRSAQLQVLVSDASGAALPAVTIVLSAETSTLAGRERITSDEAEEWTGRTDEDGRCTVTELPPRAPLMLELSSKLGVLCRIPDALVLQPGENASRSFVIGSGCSIDGVATDPDGSPVVGLELWLAGALLPARYLGPELEESLTDRVTTAEGGRFRFESVPEGLWWVGPAPGGRMGANSEHDVAPLAVDVRIAEGERAHPLSLTVWPAQSIGGRVLDSKGDPVPRARIDALARADGWRIESSADAAGAFELGPVAPGLYELRALGSRDECASESALVHDGTRDVCLRLRAGGSIRGVVTRSGEAKVAGARVELQSAETPPSSQPTDTHGRFHFDALEPGNYRVTASTDGIEIDSQGEVAVEAGAVVTIGLGLERGAELRLRVTASRGGWLGYQVWSRGALVRAGSIRAGMERSLVVPAGAVSVRLLQPEQTRRPTILDTRDLDMAPGQEAVVEFAVP